MRRLFRSLASGDDRVYLTDCLRLAVIVVAMTYVLLWLTGCGPPPPIPRPPPPVDVIGDSTLFGAQIEAPISGARGWPGSDPLTWGGLGSGSARVLWVFVGTNGTATPPEQADAIGAACQGRTCMVTLQGVRPLYDDAMRAIPGVAVCDISAPALNRPDGTHPDKVGSWWLAQRIKVCRSRLLALPVP